MILFRTCGIFHHLQGTDVFALNFNNEVVLCEDGKKFKQLAFLPDSAFIGTNHQI